jgi:hypothetical protein
MAWKSSGLSSILAVLILIGSVFCFFLPSVSTLAGIEQNWPLLQSYPLEWSVEIPPGTALEALVRQEYKSKSILPPHDLEDQQPLAPWFRNYLRKQLPDLPTSGPYQYPRVAVQMLEWMIRHPDLEARPAEPVQLVSPITPEVGAESSNAIDSGDSQSLIGGAFIGPNINITNLEEVESESSVAIDPKDPRFLVAAANNINGSGHLKIFSSSDGGASWLKTELPFGMANDVAHSDPAVAYATDGTAWIATLGIKVRGVQASVQVFKSIDRGVTWQFVKTLSTTNNNDKEYICIDTADTSPFKDSIYVAWDIPGRGVRFSYSHDKGLTWSDVQPLSSDSAIGAHLATGPFGELYVAWVDTKSHQLKLRKSTDGGRTFGGIKVVAPTRAAYDIGIPAMCRRRALIYLSLAVDTTPDSRNGWVYAAWTDRNGPGPDPGCDAINSSSNTNIYFSRSEDGGDSWALPVVVHPDILKTDQFNQWLVVDPANGSIHVIYYDTRDDPDRRKTNLYYAVSYDGGTTWEDDMKVTTDHTDETGESANINQYGDYNGLAAYNGVLRALWTDRREGTPGGKEQIYTARIESRAIAARK